MKKETSKKQWKKWTGKANKKQIGGILTDEKINYDQIFKNKGLVHTSFILNFKDVNQLMLDLQLWNLIAGLSHYCTKRKICTDS